MSSYGAVPLPESVTEITEDREKQIEADLKDEPQGFLENIAPYVAEFMGTFLIVFTMGCCAICGDKLWNPTGIGCVVVVAVYSFGPISGAHLNPAVTLARCFAFKCPWEKLPFYVLSQCAGGMVGGLAYAGIFNSPSTAPILNPIKPFSLFDVAIVEFIYTGMLCFVVLNCMASNRNNRKGDENHFFALAIGFVYIAGGYPAQYVSHVAGGLFNPAASLAVGVMSQTYFHILVYVAAQAAGGVAAGFLFGIVRPEDFKAQYDGPLDEFEVPVRSKLMAELFGTFLVCMTAGLNVVAFKCEAAPWSCAAAYISMIYSLGDVSGGHFNPCVTIAVVFSRRGIMHPLLGQSFLLNQVLGGAGAGLLFAHFSFQDKATRRDVLGVLEPHKDFSWFELCMSEGLFTMLVAFAYLAAYTSTMPPSTTKTNFYYGLVVGSCVAIGGFAVGAISSGAMNPAFAVGDVVAYVRHIISGKAKISWEHLGVSLGFTMFELVGGVAAAALFSITHQKEYLKDATGYPHVP